MKPNVNRWSRPRLGGLYLIELRHRLAQDKPLRQLIATRVTEHGQSLLRRRVSLLERLSLEPPTPAVV